MPPSSDRRLLWIIFLLSAATAIAFFFIPALVIQPFKHQTTFGLRWAMTIRQRAPWITLPAALFCLILASTLWRTPMISRSMISSRMISSGMISGATNWRAKWFTYARRAVLVLVMIPVLFSTVMSRVNYFEFMFHPVPADQLHFDSVAESKLDPSEMILAVRFADDARAYPISQMAYHHILNDEVAGVPIAVTY